MAQENESGSHGDGARPLFKRRCVLAGIGVGVVGSAVLIGLSALGPRKGPEAPGSGGAPSKGADIDVTAATGAGDAPVTVEMFGSFTCGHCADAHAETLPAIEETAVAAGEVRLVHEPFPLDPLALAVSALVTCAPESQRWAFTHLLYSEQRTWARAQTPSDALVRIAAQAGIPEQEARACLSDQARTQAVIARQDKIRAAVDIRATPTFRVRGPGGTEVLRGAVPASRIRAAVDAVK